MVSDLTLVLSHPIIFENVRKHMAAGQLTLDEEGNEMAAPVVADAAAEFEARRTESQKIKVFRAILTAADKLNEKVMVFSQRTPTLRFLQDMCEKDGRNVFCIDGHVAAEKRQGIVDRFNNLDGTAVFLIATKAGGAGLNIQGATRVVIFDFKYAPTAEETQAIGRCYRMGQTRPVFVYWLTVTNTFEESVENVSLFKVLLFDLAIDGKISTPSSVPKKELFRQPQIPVRRYEHKRLRSLDSVLDDVLNDAECKIVDVLTDVDLREGKTFDSSLDGTCADDPVVLHD